MKGDAQGSLQRANPSKADFLFIFRDCDLLLQLAKQHSDGLRLCKHNCQGSESGNGEPYVFNVSIRSGRTIPRMPWPGSTYARRSNCALNLRLERLIGKSCLARVESTRPPVLTLN